MNWGSLMMLRVESTEAVESLDHGKTSRRSCIVVCLHLSLNSTVISSIGTKAVTERQTNASLVITWLGIR